MNSLKAGTIAAVTHLDRDPSIIGHALPGHYGAEDARGLRARLRSVGFNGEF